MSFQILEKGLYSLDCAAKAFSCLSICVHFGVGSGERDGFPFYASEQGSDRVARIILLSVKNALDLFFTPCVGPLKYAITNNNTTTYQHVHVIAAETNIGDTDSLCKSV